MNLSIRLEKPEDYRAVEELTREAFWGCFHPTCDEHYLVHLLREAKSFVPELDFVAESEGRLVGNVMYSEAKIIGSGGEHAVLTFGPISVLPEYQNRGVGSALMKHSLLEAKRLGYRAVVFFGHPDYYPRFGFCAAERFGITAPGGASYDALMAMPLYDGALDGIAGEFHEDPAFNINAAEAEAFNRTFSHKEPAEMPPAAPLLEKLAPPARKAFEDKGVASLAALNNYSGRELLRWEGVDEAAIVIINQVLREHGYALKLLPDSEILKRAEQGIRVLED